MPSKELIAGDIVDMNGDVCALGALAVACGRKDEVAVVDPEDYDQVAEFFDVSTALAREVQYVNDECGFYDETPRRRWARVRAWVESHIIAGAGDGGPTPTAPHHPSLDYPLTPTRCVC